ncbi:MAG: hypothetical protein AB1714_09665 [Acidobacteriota bacterium]
MSRIRNAVCPDTARASGVLLRAACSDDLKGRKALALVKEGREQHVARENATSHICSNQALLAMKYNPKRKPLTARSQESLGGRNGDGHEAPFLRSGCLHGGAPERHPSPTPRRPLVWHQNSHIGHG